METGRPWRTRSSVRAKDRCRARRIEMRRFTGFAVSRSPTLRVIAARTHSWRPTTATWWCWTASWTTAGPAIWETVSNGSHRYRGRRVGAGSSPASATGQYRRWILEVRRWDTPGWPTGSERRYGRGAIHRRSGLSRRPLRRVLAGRVITFVGRSDRRPTRGSQPPADDERVPIAPSLR